MYEHSNQSTEKAPFSGIITEKLASLESAVIALDELAAIVRDRLDPILESPAPAAAEKMSETVGHGNKLTVHLDRIIEQVHVVGQKLDDVGRRIQL